MNTGRALLSNIDFVELASSVMIQPLEFIDKLYSHNMAPQRDRNGQGYSNFKIGSVKTDGSCQE